jgi:hypothetical protein
VLVAVLLAWPVDLFRIPQSSCRISGREMASSRFMESLGDIFTPSLKGLAVNVTRTSIGCGQGTEKMLEHANPLATVKSLRRGLLTRQTAVERFSRSS